MYNQCTMQVLARIKKGRIIMHLIIDHVLGVIINVYGPIVQTAGLYKHITPNPV